MQNLMMDSRTASDALLPGRGHSPGYGINESSDSYKIQASKTIRFNHKDRWHVVAFCALTACVISAVTGISLGYSSIIINELNGYPRNHPWYIDQSSNHASLIGVRGVSPTYKFTILCSQFYQLRWVVLY